MVFTPVHSHPVFRKKHVSAILNIRGMTRQAERQEILNIVKDIESSDGGGGDGGLPRLSRDHALFSEVPVTSEVHCLNVGLSRIALTASSCFSALRPHPRKTRTAVQENPDEVLWAGDITMTNYPWLNLSIKSYNKMTFKSFKKKKRGRWKWRLWLFGLWFSWKPESSLTFPLLLCGMWIKRRKRMMNKEKSTVLLSASV